jgi:hypothetical protein
LMKKEWSAEEIKMDKTNQKKIWAKRHVKRRTECDENWSYYRKDKKKEQTVMETFEKKKKEL